MVAESSVAGTLTGFLWALQVVRLAGGGFAGEYGACHEACQIKALSALLIADNVVHFAWNTIFNVHQK